MMIDEAPKGATDGGRGTLLGLVLFGALLRLIPLRVQSLTVDEVAALRNAGLSFRQALSLPDSFPPLYTWISSLWVRLPAGGDISLRIFSALVGLAVIWAVYQSAARLGGARAGVFGGILATCSALVLHHAQEGRMYGLVLALAAVQFAFLVKALEAESKHDPHLGAWAGFGITAVLGAYTHYYFAIWVGSCALATLVWFRGQIPRRAWLTFGIVFILSLPLLLLVEGDTAFQTSLREPHPFDLAAVGYAYFNFLAGYGLGPSRTELSWMGLSDAVGSALPWLTIFAVSAGGLAVLAFRRRLDRRRLELLLLLTIAPVFLTGAVGALVGLTFNPRFVVMAIVPILTLLGIGAGCEVAISGKSATTWAMVLCALLVSTQLFSWNRRLFDPRYMNEDVRAAAQIVMEDSVGPTFVISDYMEIPLNHYLSESRSVESFLEENEPSQVVQTSEQAEALVDAVFQRVGQEGPFRLVYTRAFHGDPEGLALDALTVRANLELERELAGVRVYRGVVPRNGVPGLSPALGQERSVTVDDRR